MEHFDFGIRVEMGGTIGSGHFFRCLSLAKKLKKRGKKVIFLISNKKEFQSHGKIKFPFLVLKNKTEKRKIQECKELMSKIKCMIVDLQSNEEDYGEKLQNENVVIIDDIGKKKIYSKIIINGSVVKKFHKYKIQNKDTKLLLDSKYMILREEFVKERKELKKLKKKITNILLIFGGSDEKNITLKILPFCLKKNLKITVVLGPTNENKQKIMDVIKKESKVKLVINPKKIAKLFSKQDLVISSTGITIYELACLGIPTIMIPINSAQKETAKEMERKEFGKIIYLEKLNFKKLEQIYLKFNDLNYREKMFNSGRNIIDGKGVERITNMMEKTI